MDKIIWSILVVLAGAMLPFQAGLNSRVGKEIASPVWASLISFVVGAIALLIYVTVTKTSFQPSGFKTVPPYAWSAGALGAFYVTVVILAFPRLGPALTFGLIVAGQLFLSLIMDHFNVLVHQQHEINWFRILGMLLIVAGVVVIRKF